MESFGLNAVNDGVLLWVDTLSRFSPSQIAHKTVVLEKHNPHFRKRCHIEMVLSDIGQVRPHLLV